MAIPLRDDEQTGGVPWCTLALIAACVVVFLFIQPAGFQATLDEDRTAVEQFRLERDASEFAYRWGAVPCELTSGTALADDPEGCDDFERGELPPALPFTKTVWVGLLTCMFLHANLLHLAGNMLFLWVFGRNVEHRLGTAGFLAVYVVGGVIGTLGFVAVNQSSPGVVIGASGAIAAVMGAFIVLRPRARILTVLATAAFQVVYIPAWIILLLYFATQFQTNEESVAWEAHAAGMLAGFLATLVLARTPLVRERGERLREAAAMRSGSSF